MKDKQDKTEAIPDAEVRQLIVKELTGNHKEAQKLESHPHH
jgi:hypothetical protein